MQGYTMGPGMMGPGMMGPRMMGPGIMGPGIMGQAVPEPRSAGAKLVKQYCTQCHGLPSPAQHTADDWPAVVVRMQVHMRETNNNGTMPIRIPSQSKIKEIIDYLQKYAS
jgi:mono/diheme cytochrome c family protein